MQMIVNGFHEKEKLSKVQSLRKKVTTTFKGSFYKICAVLTENEFHKTLVEIKSCNFLAKAISLREISEKEMRKQRKDSYLKILYFIFKVAFIFFRT